MSGGRSTSEEWHNAVLSLPHIYVQNANAISSPITWGFPAITAFVGFMTALERSLGDKSGIRFFGVGVVCHRFEPQVWDDGFVKRFRLARHPMGKDGNAVGIVEEGRAHLEVTLVFDVELSVDNRSDEQRSLLANRISEAVNNMRLAGGSVVGPIPGLSRKGMRPSLVLLPNNGDLRENEIAFRRLALRWLPGFALICRDDLLHGHLKEMRDFNREATALDALLDLSRWNYRATSKGDSTDSSAIEGTGTWVADSRKGWTVPIPVGFAGLSELYSAGAVRNARNENMPFRFVESIYSMGQWISPHRLRSIEELVWYSGYDETIGLYRCYNNYAPSHEGLVG